MENWKAGNGNVLRARQFHHVLVKPVSFILPKYADVFRSYTLFRTLLRTIAVVLTGLLSIGGIKVSEVEQAQLIDDMAKINTAHWMRSTNSRAEGRDL